MIAEFAFIIIFLLLIFLPYIHFLKCELYLGKKLLYLISNQVIILLILNFLAKVISGHFFESLYHIYGIIVLILLIIEVIILILVLLFDLFNGNDY